jgi:hypothetical protein
MKKSSSNERILIMSKEQYVNMQASAKLMDVIENISAGSPLKCTIRYIFTNRYMAATNKNRLARIPKLVTSRYFQRNR